MLLSIKHSRQLAASQDAALELPLQPGTRAGAGKSAGEKEPVVEACQTVNGKRVTLLKDQLFNRDGSFIAGMNHRAVAAVVGELCLAEAVQPSESVLLEAPSTMLGTKSRGDFWQNATSFCITSCRVYIK